MPEDRAPEEETMTLLPYHRFDHNGRSYVFNIERMFAGRVSKGTAAALDRRAAAPDAPLSAEAQEELKALRLERDRAWQEREAEAGARTETPQEPPLVNIALFVSQECNMRCTYCYGSSGEYGTRGLMEEATALRAVDWLLEQSGEEKEVGICFFGGEPLLNFPLMRKVAEEARARGKAAGKKLQFSVTTNLSLLDDEILAFLREYEVGVMVSFDGPPDVQNANRPFHDGRASYETVTGNIRRLLSALPEGRVSCRATLCGTTDPQPVVQAIRDLGFESWHISPPSPCILESGAGLGEEAVAPTRILEQAAPEANDVFALVKGRDWNSLKALGDSGRTGALLVELACRRRRYTPCDAGRGYVGVGTTGEVFVCHRFVGLGGYRLGSVSEGAPDRSASQASMVTDGGPCSDCWVKYFCGGGCMYENAAITGHARRPSPRICDLMKGAVEAALRVWCDLDERDRRYLRYVQRLTADGGRFPFEPWKR